MEEEMKKIEAMLDEMLDEDGLFTRQKNGTYVMQITLDHGDEFSDQTITEILRAEDPQQAFEEKVDDAFTPYYWGDYFNEMVDSAMRRAHEIITMDTPEEETRVWQYISDTLCEKISFEYPYEAYLDQRVTVDLVLDTGDGNYDFTFNTVYPSWMGKKGEKLDKRASIVWLSKTQGYTKTALEKELLKGDVEGDPRGYAETLRQEISSISSGMNAVTFLIKLPLRDLIKIQEVVNTRKYTSSPLKGWARKGMIHISKKTKTGLHDPWNGAGSSFEISLNNDLDVPVRFVESCLPDVTVRGESVSLRNEYGLFGGVWRNAELVTV